jgi:hypothetical protein
MYPFEYSRYALENAAVALTGRVGHTDRTRRSHNGLPRSTDRTCSLRGPDALGSTGRAGPVTDRTRWSSRDCVQRNSDQTRCRTDRTPQCQRPVGVQYIVTKFLGRWGRGTGSWYVERYLRDTFTLRVKNEPVNPGRGRRTRVEGRKW